MSREEFAKIVKTIDSVYCSSDKPLMKDALSIEIWYSCLQDLDFSVCGKAIKNLLLTSKYRPSIAEIREEYVRLIKKPSDDLTEQDAWCLVRKALRNGTYGSVEEFDKLPQKVKDAVGHPSNLSAWAVLGSSEVETVIQSQFLRNYRTVEQRTNKDYVVGAIGTKRGECSGLIASVADSLMIGEE